MDVSDDTTHLAVVAQDSESTCLHPYVRAVLNMTLSSVGRLCRVVAVARG